MSKILSEFTGWKFWGRWKNRPKLLRQKFWLELGSKYTKKIPDSDFGCSAFFCHRRDLKTHPKKCPKFKKQGPTVHRTQEGSRGGCQRDPSEKQEAEHRAHLAEVDLVAHHQVGPLYSSFMVFNWALVTRPVRVNRIDFDWSDDIWAEHNRAPNHKSRRRYSYPIGNTLTVPR